jgi:hypothetical protein
MHAKEAGKMLGGSIAIYVIMAACSAGSGPTKGSASLDAGQASSGSGSGSGGASGAASGVDGSSSSGGADGSGSGSLLDAITDPVSEASANPNQSGTRLKANYYAGSDGSKQFLGNFHDTLRNEDCSFTNPIWLQNGTIFCVPRANSGGSLFYADSACTQPVWAYLNGGVPGTYAIAIAPNGAPGQLGHFFSIGSATSVSIPYSFTCVNEGGVGCETATQISACTATGPTTPSTFYSVTEIPVSAFVQATLQTEM